MNYDQAIAEGYRTKNVQLNFYGSIWFPQIEMERGNPEYDWVIVQRRDLDCDDKIDAIVACRRLAQELGVSSLV